MRQIQRPNFNPDEFVESLGIQVPYIAEKPIASDYGLPEDAISVLKKDDELFQEKQKSNAKYTLITLVCLGAIIGYLYNGVGYALLFAFLAVWPVGLIAYSAISDAKPKDNEFRIKVKQFESDTNNFEYWARKKQRDYWKGLSGHGFEGALAQLFRKKGYTATVSKSGGDEGIDIILENNSERIIVQCKAHSKPIGPVIARELYGAMTHFNATKGMLASTNGFTPGVYEFVKGKNIELLSMNEIIAMADSL